MSAVVIANGLTTLRSHAETRKPLSLLAHENIDVVMCNNGIYEFIFNKSHELPASKTLYIGDPLRDDSDKKVNILTIY
jgi:hypothetical protein